jgi:ketosteroid isomerase-like protein
MLLGPARRTAFLLLALPACRAAGAGTLTARDSMAIDSVRAEYVRAWLADDTAGVLSTLHPEAMLLPPGRLPVEGEEAIRGFWWPTDGSRTTITRFEWSLDELRGTRGLAYTRGISTLGWRYEKDTVRVEQVGRNVSLTILTRDRNGRWRILRQMWGPPLPG